MWKDWANTNESQYPAGPGHHDLCGHVLRAHGKACASAERDRLSCGGSSHRPSVFGLLSEDFLTTINIISDVALAFIAFSIGNEFKMSYFKRVGVAPIVIACLESLFAVVFVVLGLLIARQPLPFSLVLGAIAAGHRLRLRPSWSSSSTARRAP